MVKTVDNRLQIQIPNAHRVDNLLSIRFIYDVDKVIIRCLKMDKRVRDLIKTDLKVSRKIQYETDNKAIGRWIKCSMTN